MAIPCMVISCVDIPRVVILCVVIPRVPFYTRCSMTISYTSHYYVYLASSYIRAGHTQLKSAINLQNLVLITVKGACVENAYASNVLNMHTLNFNRAYLTGHLSILIRTCINRTWGFTKL